MGQLFDLRKQLKQHDHGLLKQLFDSRGELQALDWSAIKKTQVDPIVKGIRDLTPPRRRQVQVLMQSFAKLANERGLKVIHEELSQRHADMVATWGALKNRADKVLWVYLNARDAFEEAAVFARADALSATRYFTRWSHPPCQGVPITDAVVDALKAGLRSHYSSSELRGEHCEVHRYTRLNGDEYFFAYLPDWPENFMVFNDDGELESLDIPTAFTNLFVYEPSTGALEMIATGGTSTQQELRRVFYKALSGEEVEDADPDRPEYMLDHVITSGFSFSHDAADRIDTISVCQIALIPLVDGHGLDGLQLKFRAGLPWSQCLTIIDAMLASRDLSRDQVAVDHMQLRIRFLGDGERRGKSLTIRISPRCCDLKREDDEELQVVGERLLKRWEIIDE
jgi:hypothetical protein